MANRKRQLVAIEGSIWAHAIRRTLADNRLLNQIHRLVHCTGSFNWEQYLDWGIDQRSWLLVQQQKLNPLFVFCHPRVITEQPSLVTYYYTLSVLADPLWHPATKKVQAESHVKGWPNYRRQIEVAFSLNEVISRTVIDSSRVQGQIMALPHIVGIANARLNKAISRECAMRLRTILTNHLNDEIAQIVWKDDTTADYTPELHTELIDRIGEAKVIRLKNAFHLVFASEPDVSLRDPKDQPVVAIEVKAGADPAGALERLGAAMKSFENDRALNPRVKTVYVVMSLTKAVQDRINQARLVDHTFELAPLLVDETTQRRFTNLLVSVMLGRK